MESKTSQQDVISPKNHGAGQDILSDYLPRTALGEKLLALRLAYLTSGGRLLPPEEFDEMCKM